MVCKHKTNPLASAALCLHISILTSIPLPWMPSWILNTEFKILLMQMCCRAFWSCYYIVNGAKKTCPLGQLCEIYFWKILLWQIWKWFPLEFCTLFSHATMQGSTVSRPKSEKFHLWKLIEFHYLLIIQWFCISSRT